MNLLKNGWAFAKDKKFKLLFLFKLLMSLWIAQTTEFVPDEYWQTTEVSYRYYFDRGHLTWEWLNGIRSVLVPYFIYYLYCLGAQLNILCPQFLTLMPQLVVGLMTLYATHCFHQYVFTKYGVRIARRTMFLFGLNWFTTFCGSRLITNQVEMNLNCICLYLLHAKAGFFRHASLAVLLVVNFMIRPTMAIFWLPYIPELLHKFLMVKDWELILGAIFFGFFSFLNILYIDSIWYGKYIITFWEFFKFNFLERGNAEFGTHSGFWYLYSGLPSIFGPLFVISPLVFRCTEDIFDMLVKMTPYVAMYSYLDHKEIRFMLPAVPTMCLILGTILSECEYDIKAIKFCGVMLPRRSLKKFVFRSLIFLNLVATVGIGFHHQKGIKPAAGFMYEKMKEVPFPRAWLMMPCYSLPTNTYLHNPSADFKSYVCSPKRFHNLLNKNEDNFIQANGFETVDIMADVEEKLQKSFPPHFVMTYGKVASTVQYAFRRKGYFYYECSRHRHTYFGDFHRFVVVLCASPLNLHGGRLGGFLQGS